MKREVRSRRRRCAADDENHFLSSFHPEITNMTKSSTVRWYWGRWHSVTSHLSDGPGSSASPGGVSERPAKGVGARQTRRFGLAADWPRDGRSGWRAPGLGGARE